MATLPPPTPVPTAAVVPSPANPATATQQAIVELNRRQREKFENEIRTQYRHDAETTARLRPLLVAGLDRALKAIEEATSNQNPDLPALREALTGAELDYYREDIRDAKDRRSYTVYRYLPRITADAYYYPAADHDEVNGLIVWLDPSPSRTVFRQDGQTSLTKLQPGCVFLFFSTENGIYKLHTRIGISASFCEEKKP